MKRVRLALLALAVFASGCGSHGDGNPPNALNSLSPDAQQRLLAQLDDETAAQVKRATHGRIDPKQSFRQEFCTPKNDRQVVCTVKGVGKHTFEWRWLVTINGRSDRYRIQLVEKHLPAGRG